MQLNCKKPAYYTCGYIAVGTRQALLLGLNAAVTPDSLLAVPVALLSDAARRPLQGFTDGFGSSRSGTGRSSASSSSGGYGGYSSGRKASQPEDDYSFVSERSRNLFEG